MEKYKIVTKYNEREISAPTWHEVFNYLMDHILYEIFNITLNIFLKILGSYG